MFRSRRGRRARPISAPTSAAARGDRDLANVIEIKVVDEDGLAGDLSRWERLFASALEAEGVVGPGEATLVFVDAVAISQLNRLHMGSDQPTDVLSFPIDGSEPLMPGERRIVGDVVVCPEVAAVNAPGHAGTTDDELALLIVHGALHLCGHDHAEPAERDVMWRRERDVLCAAWDEPAAWNDPAGDPWST